MLQASVCDEQLMSIGGEIALSGNKTGRLYILYIYIYIYAYKIWLGVSAKFGTCSLSSRDTAVSVSERKRFQKDGQKQILSSDLYTIKKNTSIWLFLHHCWMKYLSCFHTACSRN